MLYSPISTAFVVNGYEVKMYGVLIFLAIVAGIFVTNVIAKKYYKYVSCDILFDFYPVMIIAGIICARLYYVLLNWHYYSQKPAEIIALWHGGISIHGAIIGGLLAGIFYFKRRNLRILEYADVISFGLVVGQIIGRWGNFFNSEAFGTPTNLPWKLYIAPSFRPIEYYTNSYFHPTFLYESLWCLFTFIILFFVVRKFQKNRSGMIFYSYLALYSLGRFFIEGIRIDSVFYVGNMPIAQLVSIIVFVIGVAGVIYCIKKTPDNQSSVFRI